MSIQTIKVVLVKPVCSGGTGSGDVVGPNSATDGHLALFDGATGKLIKDGGVPGTGTPGGSDTEIQFNDSNAFGGVTGFTYDGSTVTITGPDFSTANIFNDYSSAKLFFYNPIITDDFVNGYELSTTFLSRVLRIRSNITTTRANISFIPNDSIANYPALINVFSTDYVADPVNYASIAIISKGTGDTYHTLTTSAAGTGVFHPINIEAAGTLGATAQLVVGTDGGVSIGTGTSAGSGNLRVAKAVTHTALTVATLPTGELGMVASVTDGDPALSWGDTVVNSGGGTTNYLVWFNGSNWTVTGK